MGERKAEISMLEFAVEGFVFKKTTCMFHTHLTAAGMEQYLTGLNKGSRKCRNVFLLSFT